MSKGSQASFYNKEFIIIIFLILNMCVVLGVAFMQFQSHQREVSNLRVNDFIKSQRVKEDRTDTGEAVEKAGILLSLDPFTVNLAENTGPRRYLRLKVVLKFSMRSDPDEFKSHIPQIRDSIINTINTKRAEDLFKVDGKQYLKEEIQATINAFLVNGNVINIFYVSFQIN